MNPSKHFLPAARTPRRIKSGLLRGLRLHLNLQNEFMIWLGLYERETFRAMATMVRGCRSGIDLGAAKGDLSLWLLAQPGIEKVIAVEPLDREVEQFRNNLLLNDRDGDPRLTLYQGIVGSEDAGDHPTLDRLASDLPSPVFIKIDIDGPESEVLAAASKLLSTKDCRLLIETHSSKAEHACLQLLIDHGYTSQIIRPAWWRVFLPERRPLPHNRWLAARPQISPPHV